MSQYACNTIEEAREMLNGMILDVQADMGEEAVEAGYRDIVHACCDWCSPEVADELLRREGFDPPIYRQARSRREGGIRS